MAPSASGSEVDCLPAAVFCQRWLPASGGSWVLPYLAVWLAWHGSASGPRRPRSGGAPHSSCCCCCCVASCGMSAGGTGRGRGAPASHTWPIAGRRASSGQRSAGPSMQLSELCSTSTEHEKAAGAASRALALRVNSGRRALTMGQQRLLVSCGDPSDWLGQVHACECVRPGQGKTPGTSGILTAGGAPTVLQQ